MENTKGTSAKEQSSESKTSNKKSESKTSNEKAESETSDGVKEITAGMARLGGSWDYQLRKEFEMTDGKASDIILGSLSPEDQGFFQDVQSAKNLWESLQDRYRQPDSVMADRYAAKIVSFQYKPQRTLAGNWAKILD
ncbi:hypothetical protein E4U10_003637 [Claviceps purpurea]|nr:hypothetical protein E4U10_003637 [Claviceps purpurea]